MSMHVQLKDRNYIILYCYCYMVPTPGDTLYSAVLQVFTSFSDLLLPTSHPAGRSTILPSPFLDHLTCKQHSSSQTRWLSPQQGDSAQNSGLQGHGKATEMSLSVVNYVLNAADS